MAVVSTEQLKKLIETSSLLLPEEREEWLRTVEFMNDKQVQDLYSILAPENRRLVQSLPAEQNPVPAVPLEKTNKEVAGPGTPLQSFLDKTLRQTSRGNEPVLPVKKEPVSTQPLLNKKPEQARPPTMNAAGKAWQQKVALQVKEKELPPGPRGLLLSKAVTPLPPRSQPETKRVLESVPEKKNAAASGVSMSAFLDATAPPTKSVVSQADSAPEVALEPEGLEPSVVTKINSVEDVQKIGIMTLERMGVEALVEQLNRLTREHGYFPVLLELEKSPLYEAYIVTGKKMLASQDQAPGQPKEPDTLTRFLSKEEFESVVDLLQAIKA